MRVRGISLALPRRRVTSEEIAEWTGADAEFIRTKIGVAERGFLGPDESTSDLAVEACERLFREHPELERAHVELLVLVTQAPDHRTPHTSAAMQTRLGLDPETACFDLKLGCSGYVYGLTAVKGFMLAQGLREAVLVTCDPPSKGMRKTDRDTIAVLGDAATATWISADAGAEIGRGDFGTDGSGAEHLWIPDGGSARPHVGVWLDEPAHPIGDGCYVQMNGRAIFNFVMRRVPHSIDACLAANGLSLDEIDLFAFHQPSRFVLESLQKQLRIPDEKMLWNLEKHGNTVSSTIPLALAERVADGSWRGSKVLVSGFGSGLSWATNVLFA